MNSPLQGVRVVDFGQFIAAPAATQLLADLGADVIKVEAKTGDSARSIGVHGQAMVNAFNRGKRSIALDLKSPEGLRVAVELVGRADIVIQNLRPGVMESFGLGGGDVVAKHPHIVYASITAWGSTGPSRLRPGLDITAQAESGIMHMTGDPKGEPQKVGCQIIDAATAYAAATAVLGAYVNRLRTGRGEVIETSLLEVATHVQAPMLGAYFATGVEPKRLGNGQPTVAPAADVMTTSDGAFIVSAYSEPHFARLCELIGRRDMVQDNRFSSNAARVRNKAALLAELRQEFGKFTTDEALALLTSNGVVAGRISTYGDIAANEDVKASGILIKTTGPLGEIETVGAPWQFANAGPRNTSGAPALGEHTEQVLLELGFSVEEIVALATTGAVGIAETAVTA
ncbi:carnitine dehydratase [Arthrobacter sp. ERGS1:01]|uniref:CaiB/BaiF CoA transferase family protein n=1 Tax=Arthrobacter sp. ERGS1:01 TaxID=1704044 RepID=UPI0006B63088|nr:CoA transferase [Arthrobacter sp. ERGS1:01]ALE05684.1 carnitine dehydratase [Arthrobacter sp. ERGS1:01]